MVFVLSLFVPRLSFFCCFETAVLRDCGISWVSSLVFSYHSGPAEPRYVPPFPTDLDLHCILSNM